MKEANECMTINATETSFRIIEALVEINKAGVSELARHVDTPVSTIYDHLDTLRKLGYVKKKDEYYILSSKFLYFGEAFRKQMDLYNTAKPELRNLSNEIEEHVSLVIEEDGAGVYIYTAESDSTVRIIAPIGTKVGLHTTAPGKAMLAHFPKERVEEILDHHGLPARTENTITNHDELWNVLSEVQTKGYALDIEEEVYGLSGIAVPVIHHKTDEVLGSICVYAPANEPNIERFENEISEELRRRKNIVEVNITYE